MDPKIISQGLTFLQKQQLPNGGFLSLSSDTNFKKSISYQTVFSTALILSCLSSLPKTTELQKLVDLAVKFLLTQKSVNWSFNYWQRGSKESKTMLNPDALE